MTPQEALELEDRIVHCLPNHELKEAAYLAFDAMREQEQREQGCGWCDYFERDRQFLIGEGNGMYKELIYQFCPMCGRRLEEV